MGYFATESLTGPAHSGYRYYSPSLGRWLSRDPLETRCNFNCSKGYIPQDVRHYTVEIGTPAERGDAPMNFVEVQWRTGRFWFNLSNLKVTWTESQECCSSGRYALNYVYTADLELHDELGFSEDTLQYKVPAFRAVYPPRVVTRASWPVGGTGTCCPKK